MMRQNAHKHGRQDLTLCAYDQSNLLKSIGYDTKALQGRQPTSLPVQASAHIRGGTLLTKLAAPVSTWQAFPARMPCR